MEYLSLSPTYLFIQSIISVRTNRCLFYTSLFNMLLKLFVWTLRILAAGSYVPLANLHYCGFICFISLNTSLPSGPKRCLRLILYTSCSFTRISHFSKGPWFLLLEDVIKKQDLSTGCAHCGWGVAASQPSQLIEQGNVDLTLTHVRTYLYFQR